MSTRFVASALGLWQPHRMIRKFLSLPWGRFVCVLGATAGCMAMANEREVGRSLFLGFLFAGVALHGIAAYRHKAEFRAQNRGDNSPFNAIGLR